MVTVGWFGYKPNAGWANVFFGRWILDGQVIKGMSGEWCDIPWGSYLRNGELAIDFHPGAPTPDSYRVSEVGGFGGSTWTRTNNPPHFPGLPQGNRNFPIESLNGVWQTDKNEFYYMRELPSGVVFWFAIRSNLEIAHVARGRRQLITQLEFPGLISHPEMPDQVGILPFAFWVLGFWKRIAAQHCLARRVGQNYHDES